jgi:hypothetical protein
MQITMNMRETPAPAEWFMTHVGIQQGRHVTDEESAQAPRDQGADAPGSTTPLS